MLESVAYVPDLDQVDAPPATEEQGGDRVEPATEPTPSSSLVQTDKDQSQANASE